MRARGFNPAQTPPRSELQRSHDRRRQIETLAHRAERRERSLAQADNHLDRARAERRLDALNRHLWALQAQEAEMQQAWPEKWRCPRCGAPTAPLDYGHARCAACANNPDRGGH